MNSLNKLGTISSLIGIDFAKVLSLRYLPKYIYDLTSFRIKGGKVNGIYPILTDFNDSAGVAKGHYFHQDLLVAERIFKENPTRHIDIGSRIDGFIAHVASYRQIEIFDIRNLESKSHPNIKFRQKNLMEVDNQDHEIADSISCLHTIEHFGLGRYGDFLDPNGYKQGFDNLFKMLKPNGILYISFPISNVSRTEFNAHRVFNPLDIFTWSENCEYLELKCFDYVDDDGDLHVDCNLNQDFSGLRYGCGIYTFKKHSNKIQKASEFTDLNMLKNQA